MDRAVEIREARWQPWSMEDESKSVSSAMELLLAANEATQAFTLASQNTSTGSTPTLASQSWHDLIFDQTFESHRMLPNVNQFDKNDIDNKIRLSFNHVTELISLWWLIKA